MATFKIISLTVVTLVAICSAAPKKKFGLKVPDECKGKGFCSIKPEGYDEMQEMVSALLTKNLIAQNLGDRSAGEGLITNELSPETDWHNCPTRRSVLPMYAYSYPNETDAEYIIQNESYMQLIESVQCANDKINVGSQECFQGLGLGAYEMEFSCVTSSSTRSILVFDYKKGEIKQKAYDVPCCCSCQISGSN